MSFFDLAAILVSLAALFSWINYRFLRLPVSIALTILALFSALLILLFDHLGFALADQIDALLRGIDFPQALLYGMLSFLLFAGALHVNLQDLYSQRWIISIMASVGVLASTALIGFALYYLLPLFGFEMSLAYCLVFGALISPTDPIAVLGIMKSSGAPASLQTKMAGESLFNDGIAVVVFAVLLTFASSDEPLTAGNVALLFAEEALGGLLFGLLLGYVSYRMLRQVHSYQVEILITLATVMGGYSLAHALHTSGPLAIVVAGLFIGNHGRLFAMSDETTRHLDSFWELLDEIFNAVLFLLIGLEFVLLSGDWPLLPTVFLAIPLIVLVRFVVVAVPVSILKRWRKFSPGAIAILAWGGLRGGISIALALSLPAGEARELILVMTYAVVLFSVLAQGLSIARLVRYYQK
ncbi:MAG: sodium:proton antiporter [gamma proteobacterium symbiont of Bathyaustriella thionipta]|nr:sodium:proton antiporter [gamma proteobacterium symbiont of Bathyaustriella thionipta]